MSDTIRTCAAVQDGRPGVRINSGLEITLDFGITPASDDSANVPSKPAVEEVDEDDPSEHPASVRNPSSFGIVVHPTD